MTVLVASPGPDAGKTLVALALARAAGERGETVGYLKPKGTGAGAVGDGGRDRDPALAREVLGSEEETPRVAPVVYSPAFVGEALRGREDPEALRRRVRERFENLAGGRDRLLLEGGRALQAGGVVGLADPDVAELLDAAVVLVAGYGRPGDVDDVLAAADRFGDRLGGVLFNAVPDAAFDDVVSDVAPFLEGRGVRVYGAVPRDPDLAAVSASDLAAELDAAVLTDGAPTDGPVRRFVLGVGAARGTRDRLGRVREAALLARGDRPDLLGAALAAPGVACLVLTDGVRPPGDVLDRAESAGVPVLLAQTDAVSTLDRATAVVRSGAGPDAAGVTRMGELLADYADVDAMLGGHGTDPGDDV